MAPARSTEAALRAEILQLKAQLSAERCASQRKSLITKDQLLASKDQLLAKNEALAALRLENMALKTEQLQQFSTHEATNALATEHTQQYDSSSIDVTAALDRDELLDHVFSYVGGGDHLFVAGVNRCWRGEYLQYCAFHGKAKRTKKKATRYCSTIITESRLQHAKLNGFCIADLDITERKHAELICRQYQEPERVIAALRLRAASWDSMICENAAYYGKLGLLQWLHINDCEWDEDDVLINASRGENVPVLQWVATVITPWPEDTLIDMFNDAASRDKLAAAQWLRAYGAQWSDKFTSNYTDANDATAKQCWSLPAVQWAIASGSGWLEWKCKDYDAGKYRKSYDKRRARDVLNWAHANGCPCSCGHQRR
jgi:hypothetical protein